MSLRSAVFAALLLAALAAAYWPDLFTANWFNVTATKICAIDAPTKCYYVPKPPFDVGKYTFVVAVYTSGGSTYYVFDSPGKYLMLNYITYSSSGTSWAIVNITRPGILYSTSGSSYTVKSGSTAMTTATYTVCGKTYNYAVYIQNPGLYNVTPFKPPYYLVDLSSCREYRIADIGSNVANLTMKWFGLYVAELLPVTRAVYYDQFYGQYTLNGTEHAYVVKLYAAVAPVGAGVYIGGGAAVPTVVVSDGNWYGPRHFSGWRNATNTGRSVWHFYNIGQTPSDGVFAVNGYFIAWIYGPLEFTFLTSNSTGYFMLNVAKFDTAVVLHATRFDVVEVTVRDSSSYLYNTRGVACPAYYPYGSTAWWIPNRLDRLGEVEICNNRTSTVVVVLYYSNSLNLAYFYGDIIQPGKCAKLRWDTLLSSSPPLLYVYGTVSDFCKTSGAIMATTNYKSGWRYFLFGNNTLKQAAALTPDYDYASTWMQLLNYTRQLYNNLTKAYSAWLNATIAASKTMANMSLSNFIASLPKFTATIKMDSSTSTWLKTTLNELQKWQAVGPAVGGAVSVSLQAPSAFTASAAAAAVATAWAASRKSLATAAFLAGFAILATSLFVYYLYGAMVSAGLILAAVALMSIGAAAAWFRKSED